MAVAGYFSLIQLPINSLPDVTPIQVLVITKAGRYSPFDVEKLVSYPIETAMNGLPDVAEVRSISQFGLSAVTVEFEEKTDIFFARQMVSQRLQSISDELPPDVRARGNVAERSELALATWRPPARSRPWPTWPVPCSPCRHGICGPGSMNDWRRFRISSTNSDTTPTG